MSKRRPGNRRVDYYRDPDAPSPTSRRPSASALVRDSAGRVLTAPPDRQRALDDPDRRSESRRDDGQCAIRECEEETGIRIEITGLVGVFSDPGHVIAYHRGGKLTEVRQPVNVCFHGRPIGGTLTPDPVEATEVRWVEPGDLGDVAIHPAIQVRIDHGLTHPDDPLIG